MDLRSGWAGAVVRPPEGGTAASCTHIARPYDVGDSLATSSRSEWLSRSNQRAAKRAKSHRSSSETYWTLDGSEWFTHFATKTHDATGAIYLRYDRGIIFNCLFVNNTADSGGAIYISSNGFTIKNSTFRKNNGKKEGGSVYISSKDVILEDSTFLFHWP